MAIVTLAVASVCAYKLGKHYKEKHDEKKEEKRHHKRSHSHNPSHSSTYHHGNRSASSLECDCKDCRNDERGEFFYYDEKKSKSKSNHKRSHSTSRLPQSSSTSKLPLMFDAPAKSQGTHLMVPGQQGGYPPAMHSRVGLNSDYYDTHPANPSPPPPPSVYAPSYGSTYSPTLPPYRG